MIPAGVLGHPLPWTESDYLALGETVCRIELLDGGLLIGPPPAVRHQLIVGAVATALEPGCAAANRTLYAAAGIEWYLLVDQEDLTVHLHQRQGGHYAEAATVKAGEVLELAEPVRATIRPEDLLA